MHESTFPFWVIVLLIGAAFAYFVGYASPYVTKESREEVKKYVKGENAIRPKIIIKNRTDSETVICLSVGLAIVWMIFFFCDGFSNLIMRLGGGTFASIFAVLIFLISFGLTFFGMLFMYLFGATVSSGMLERRYKDRYNVDAELVLDEPEVNH